MRSCPPPGEGVLLCVTAGCWPSDQVKPILAGQSFGFGVRLGALGAVAVLTLLTEETPPPLRIAAALASFVAGVIAEQVLGRVLLEPRRRRRAEQAVHRLGTQNVLTLLSPTPGDRP
jgi:hypothetical protein